VRLALRRQLTFVLAKTLYETTATRREVFAKFVQVTFATLEPSRISLTFPSRIDPLTAGFGELVEVALEAITQLRTRFGARAQLLDVVLAGTLLCRRRHGEKADDDGKNADRRRKPSTIVMHMRASVLRVGNRRARRPPRSLTADASVCFKCARMLIQQIDAMIKGRREEGEEGPRLTAQRP
jgi:hypothetical protein